jgi:hypothetical protein
MNPSEERGLEPRYYVHRIDDPMGKHNECRFFVLDPQHDPIARIALRAYAQEARVRGHAALADDLFAWLAEATLEARRD